MEHTFGMNRTASAEPREALVANVAGYKDRKKDLIVAVRDRILVYPQE